MRLDKLKSLLIVIFALAGLLISVQKCTGQTKKIKQASRWYNQKPIDTGPSSLIVGYSCQVINRQAHGLTVGYASRSGVEMGISKLASFSIYVAGATLVLDWDGPAVMIFIA